LKKKVTWAYFSVSAVWSCLSPALLISAASVFYGASLEKSTG